MARACACAGEWLELPWRSHHNVDVFLAAAWIFNVLLRFARAEPGRAAHIGTIGIAWCVWWCRWEERRRARSSRAASVLNFARDVSSACATTWDRLVG